MDDPISSIHNLGPATEAQFAAAGVTSARQLRQLGADEGFRRLLASGVKPHFMSYLVLVTALADRPWNDCDAEEKAVLRQKFEQLKAEVLVRGLPAQLERVLREIGVIEVQP